MRTLEKWVPTLSNLPHDRVRILKDGKEVFHSITCKGGYGLKDDCLRVAVYEKFSYHEFTGLDNLEFEVPYVVQVGGQMQWKIQTKLQFTGVMVERIILDEDTSVLVFVKETP